MTRHMERPEEPQKQVESGDGALIHQLRNKTADSSVARATGDLMTTERANQIAESVTAKSITDKFATLQGTEYAQVAKDTVAFFLNKDKQSA